MAAHGDTTAALSERDLTAVTETFRLLGDPSRLKILLCCMEGPKPVSEIGAALGLSQSLVSHHLRLLRAARLVRGERRSRQVFYEIDDAHVSAVLSDTIAHVREEREGR